MMEISDGNVNLVIGPDQQAAFQRTLDGLTAKEGVGCVLLIDTAGKIIAEAGSLGRLDLTTVAALAAGDFATTRALARRVGEKDFSLVFQREREVNAYLQAVGDESLLVVLFDQAEGLGTMRVLVRAAQGELKRTLDECPRTVVGPDALQAVVEEKKETGAAETAEAPKPAAPKLVRNPPADLIRKFWRIKTLAEDCVKGGVPVTAAAEWRSARDRIALVATSIAAGDAVETRRLLGEVEAILMKAYDGVVAARAAEDEEAMAVGIWHGLVARSGEVFARGLGEHASAVLAHVDRDSAERHPDVLGKAEGGRIPADGLRPLARWPRDRRRQAVARAFLDLLLNRLWVVDKILGRPEGDALVEAWRKGLASRAGDAWPAGIKPAIGYLFAHAGRRNAGRSTPPPSRAPAGESK